MSKGLDALNEMRKYGAVMIPNCEIIEKELKALELIKPLVELTKGKSHCWLWIGLNGMNITQEQYDLLKEVLEH